MAPISDDPSAPRPPAASARPPRFAPAEPRRSPAARWRWIGGSALCLVVLATGVSPTATERGAGLGPSAALAHGVPPGPTAGGTAAQRFPRFRFAAAEPAPEAALSSPVAARAAAQAPSVAAGMTHRMDRPDAALAVRFAPPAAALSAAIAQADGSPFGDVADEPEASRAVPLPEAARLAREAALADGDIAALVVPLPTLRPRNDDAPGASLAPAVRPEPPAVPVLAYARPDAGASGAPAAIGAEPQRARSPRPERGTAIYDISAATVYLPSGERLEAHSGLGAMRDDVRFVREKMRGPTPPHTYDLTLRESLFHGVQALRLNPVGGERRIHNRVGLLAHTYMLGPKGDSNGCVSFKDYKRFLAAYRRGEVRRLVVVDKLDVADTPKPASLLARLVRGAG